jgi:hypothetical protein
MDLVKYLLRQKQQLAINKEKIGSTTVITAKQPVVTEAPKQTIEPMKNTIDTNGKSVSKPVEPVTQVANPKLKEDDDFLNNFEMPGKFAVPDKVAKNTNTITTVKTEKPKDPVVDVRAPVDSDATILYDSPEQAAASNGAVAANSTILPKKRKLEDSDDGSKTKKARLESTQQDFFDFLRKIGMKNVISLQIRRSKHEAPAEWGELGLNGSVQFKFSNKIAATPAALLDLFLQEKELESSTKINAWTHLYLDEELILSAPQIFEKTAFGHFKKFKFPRGTKIDTIRGMLFFAKELEKKSAIGSIDDVAQLIFKTVSYSTFCSLHGIGG